MRGKQLFIIFGFIFLFCIILTGNDNITTPKVANENGNITITGAGNAMSIIYKLDKGLYLLSFRYKGEPTDHFDAVSNKSEGKSSLIMANGFSKASSGYCAESKIHESYISEIDTVNVESNSDWTIAFEKFPLKGEIINGASNIKGSGTNISKLMKLKKGNANFNIKCPDTKRGNFRILLRDAATGEKVIMKFLASNSKNLSEGKKDYSDKQNVQIPNDGLYFLEIIASGNAAWEINVMQ